jgi:signal transduction histidine kinase
MRRTLELFLNTSRIERAALKSSLDEVDVGEVLEQTVETARHLHPEAVFVAPPPPPELKARTDPYMLVQILMELLDNAAKYSGAKPKVVVSTVQSRESVQVVVKDNGPGIPTYEREAIFQRFSRGSTARGPGSGLGLFIVQQLGEASGAQVLLVDSGPRGSTFEVKLPLQRSAVGSPTASLPKPS